MSNNGLKIVLTLQQVNSVTFVPTGLTEPNTPGDPDYIPPYEDLTDCPISYSLACPIPILQGYTGSIGYEFSLYNSVVQNPKVTEVWVNAYTTGSVFVSQNAYGIPTGNPNYFSGSVNILDPGYYYIAIQYLSGSAVIGTCSYSSSVIYVP